jgi:vitamin B12 transporter
MFPTLLPAALAALFVQQPTTTPPPRDSARLAEIVVSASRTAPAARVRTQAADLFTAGELAARGLDRLEQALRHAAGTGLVATGAPGGVASLFLRGVNSNQTLLLVDGVRVSDANLPPGSLVGGFDLAAGDRLEVVRGPQSPLHGGAAIGGVVAVAPDAGATRGWRARAAAGSFATWRGELSGAGTAGRLALGGSVSFSDTDHQRPDNRYDQRSQALRATFAASERLTVGATFRGLQQSYTSPGDLRTTNTTPVGVTTFENHLGTGFAELALAPGWTSRLTAGVQDYFLRGTSRFNGGPEFVSRLEATRTVLDWQHRLRPARGVTAAAGVNAEWTTVTGGSPTREERLRAAYAEAALTPVPSLVVTAGLRADDYSTFDAAVTGRVGVSWFAAGLATKFRGSLGTGFLPPSLTARYGSAFQRANPGIRPERSTGWDLGADVFVAGGRGMLAVTVFGNQLRDLIGFEPAAFPALGRSVNVARARTRGVEVSGRLVAGAVDLRTSYTFLDADALDQPDPALRRLIRRPAHALSADAVWAAAPGVRLGAGLTGALGREDTDFNVFPFARVNPGDYVDARLHGSVAVTRGLAVRGALENLFDERYEEVYGFPALGRRVTAGLEVRW